MNKIIPENVAVLGTTFMLLHEEGGAVDMGKGDFHPCGTVACHAGWFAAARGLKRKCQQHFRECYNFLHSANDMASFLGFTCEGELEDFFEANHCLWGNNRPLEMFATPEAFGKGYYESLTLLDIGEHWAKVYDRLIEAGY